MIEIVFVLILNFISFLLRLCGDILYVKYSIRFQKHLGLFFNINYPWFAYSADGLLERDSVGKRMLIKIKNPELGITLSGIH